jgi:hypothetical protein
MTKGNDAENDWRGKFLEGEFTSGLVAAISISLKILVKRINSMTMDCKMASEVIEGFASLYAL